jgi:hypothetical protein
MAGGASATVIIQAKVTGGGSRIVNSASASSPNHDPVAGNNTASVTVDIKGKPSR